jgi:hypothetical protein
MKKLEINKLEIINGGMNCFMAGAVGVLGLAVAVGSTQPYLGVAIIGTAAPDIVRCWNSKS